MATPPTAPVTDRPVFPAGYGLPMTTGGMLSWSDVERRLVPAIAYWSTPATSP
ncbi:MAG: hypothetical protein ACOH2F_13230 [Cellulomonas sp.]